MARVSKTTKAQVQHLDAQGYPHWKIAQILNLTEAQVVRILSLF